jgi:outer membrane protein assembly factor BamB
MSNTSRSRFPWIPVVILALALSGIFYVQSLPELERNLKSWLFAAIPLLTGILLLLWFLCSSRFKGKTRLIGLGLVCVLAVFAKVSLRADGTLNGTGLPRLVWKWTSKKSPALTAVKTGEVSSADPKRLAEAADVPQFFGANRDGIVSGVKLDRDWKSHPPKELWRQPIGEGWSAFSVVQGRAFTQEQRGEEELVTCYDLWSGALLWSHSDRARFFQWQGGAGPRATPTVMDGRVYTYGGTGLLNCLDAATGKAIWQKSVLTENGLTNIEWGVSASPLIAGDLVVVTGAIREAPLFSPIAARRVSSRGKLAMTKRLMRLRCSASSVESRWC